MPHWLRYACFAAFIITLFVGSKMFWRKEERR